MTETLTATSECPRTFLSDGYVGPVPLLSETECRTFAQAHTRGEIPPGAGWHKGVAVSSRLVFDLATRDDLLDRVTGLLGGEVMLWGAMLIERSPGERHHWHTDIETSDPDARAVAVWIGLEQTSRQSSLRLITGSHRLGCSVQEVAQRRGRSRDEAGSEEVAAWARGMGAVADVLTLDMKDGDALFFDGRIWHGSHNTRQSATRLALLQQYATSDTAIRMPDSSSFEWPFRFLPEPPPVLLVRGSSQPEGNRFVSAPPLQPKGILAEPWIRQLDPPLDRYSTSGWSPHDIFHGQTPCLGALSCHASTLDPGATPHPPHCHDEEEVLVVLDGEADLVVRSGETDNVFSASPGAVSYYPAGCLHTLRNQSDAPVTYLMFKWTASERRRPKTLGAAVYRQLHDSLDPVDSTERSFTTANVFGGPTRYLKTLHAHRSAVRPGGGYDPHSDPYDVALIVTSGVIETLGQQVRSGGVVFYPAGASHGLRNRSAESATYLVVEFQGPGGTLVKPTASPWRRARKWGRRQARGVVRRIGVLARLVPTEGR